MSKPFDDMMRHMAAMVSLRLEQMERMAVEFVRDAGPGGVAQVMSAILDIRKDVSLDGMTVLLVNLADLGLLYALRQSFNDGTRAEAVPAPSVN